MRHTVPALVSVLLLAASSLPGLSRADLDRVIDFSVTLKSLATAAEQGSALPEGKTVLLSGTVSDVAILAKDESGFKVRIELITGEWIGLDDVKAYTCYVEFTGPEYARIFPARPPREPNRQLVTLNSRVLVVGRVVGMTSDPQGGRRVLVDGAYIRTIE